MSWRENLAYCENLNYAGKGDWRLPNIYEMMSILNYDPQDQPYSDFPGVSKNIVYLSSSSIHGETISYYKRYSVSMSGEVDRIYSYSSGNSYIYTSGDVFKCVRSDCGEGKFWDGTGCVTPCASNPCGSVSHSNGSCKKSGSNGYECGCNTDEGYFWNGSSCVNPCDADPCNSKAHSVCTPYSWNVSVCSCDNESDGYFWNGSSCVNPCNSNPCASIAHARAYECSATGFNNYSCGCDAGYSWADGKCLPNCASGSATPCFDPSSGLIWSAKALNTMNLSDAIDYCDSYSEGGFGDWHLPNINELRTLVINCSKIEPGGICLAPDGYLSLRTEVPSVAHFHDLSFEHFPKDMPSLVLWHYRKYFPKFAHKARRIITVSEFSKKDICECYNIDTEKIDVVYNGANEIFVPLSAEEQQQIRDRYTQGKPYFMFVGSLHPRKNLARLFRAYDLFKKQSAADVKLVIVGEKRWWTEDIRQAYEGMSCKEEVVFLGHLSAEKLHEITAAAYASVYVSYFEGFGIPIVEAFRCKVPVITSNVTSMPEVAAGAALLADPFDENDIAKAMLKIQDEKLRSDLIVKGWERKNCFSSLARKWVWSASILAESHAGAVRYPTRQPVMA